MHISYFSSQIAKLILLSLEKNRSISHNFVFWELTYGYGDVLFLSIWMKVTEKLSRMGRSHPALGRT
jgi:hypothetical protein